MFESIPVIYCDEQIAVVDKPSGLLVHRSERSSDRSFMLQILRNQLGRTIYPVHRLDRATSGVMVYALDSVSAAALAGDFATGAVQKSYLAVARGWIEEEILIEHPLREHRDAIPQPSATLIRPLAKTELDYPVGTFATARYTLTHCRPYTGRMHQIRRHLSHAAHPVINDNTYGDSRHNRFFKEFLQARRMLLHAQSISFRHPLTGIEMLFSAAPPPDMRATLALLGWA